MKTQVVQRILVSNVVLNTIPRVRHPSKKHNVARLRAFLNGREKFDQEQFAELIGCSVHTLQSIETGRLKLSEELAHRIASETWVDVDWLLKNNRRARIVGTPQVMKRGGPLVLNPSYTFECYERAQASKIRPDEYKAEGLSAIHLDHIARTLRAILFSAHKRRRLNVALWKVSKFLSVCKEQFGFSQRMALQHEREQEALERAAEQWERSSRRQRGN